ncbi:MAG: metal dependent phosphohydrolase [Chloroflexi bacterium]|nr:metal dependent phosphohydrolase [Chloroflexota bacterium]
MDSNIKQPGTPAAQQWRSRPGLSRMIRLAVLVIPTVASLAVFLLLERLLPRPAGGVATVTWWLLTTAGSLATLTIGVRLMPRLLPLASLLELSLVFPDRAPRRFAVARSSWRVRDVQQRLDEARERGAVGADLSHAQDMLTLVAALSVHDRKTRGHSERVRVFTDMIADECRLPDEDRALLRWASLLHDVGKIHVPVDILNKPGRPTADEWEVLQRHPADGARMIAPLASWLGPWALAVEQHHERWDGTGYPRRLAGEDISLGGRVVAVADAFETMTAARPYKRAMSVAAARQELVDCSGKQFDPVVVRAFLTLSVGQLWRVVGFGAWVAQVPSLAAILEGLGGAGAHVAARTATAATALGLAAGGAAAMVPAHRTDPTPRVSASGSIRALGPVSPAGSTEEASSTATPPAGGGGAASATSSAVPSSGRSPVHGPATPVPFPAPGVTAGPGGSSTVIVPLGNSAPESVAVSSPLQGLTPTLTQGPISTLALIPPVPSLAAPLPPAGPGLLGRKLPLLPGL